MFGGLVGFLTVGILTDLIGRGIYLYAVLFWFHIFNTLLVLANLVSALLGDSSNHQNWSHPGLLNGFVGWLVTINFVLLFYVLPLYIASKIREKRSYWEIPMAAQTFALFTLLLVLVSTALGPTLYILFGFDK